jgi:hypothetical protein
MEGSAGGVELISWSVFGVRIGRSVRSNFFAERLTQCKKKGRPFFFFFFL